LFWGQEKLTNFLRRKTISRGTERTKYPADRGEEGGREESNAKKMSPEKKQKPKTANRSRKRGGERSYCGMLREKEKEKLGGGRRKDRHGPLKGLRGKVLLAGEKAGDQSRVKKKRLNKGRRGRRRKRGPKIENLVTSQKRAAREISSGCSDFPRGGGERGSDECTPKGDREKLRTRINGGIDRH